MWKSLVLGAAIALAPLLSVAQEEATTSGPTATSYKLPSRKKAPARKSVRRAPASGSYRHVSLAIDPDQLALRSNAVLVFDQSTGQPIYTKNVDAVHPIASITKLMTAVVVMESKQDLDETVTIDDGDIDTVKNTHSRLKVGTVVHRADLLRLALMASENRAAAALARTSPGGTTAFVARMNAQAAILGLTQTHFSDSTGLSYQNVSSPTDLAKLVQAAYQYPLIREYSTTPGLLLTVPDSGRSVTFNNTNMLVKNSGWHIGLSKTGFINESGQCLVMQAYIGARPFVIVLLDAWGKYSRISDANRVKKWLEAKFLNVVAAQSNLATAPSDLATLPSDLATLPLDLAVTSSDLATLPAVSPE